MKIWLNSRIGFARDLLLIALLCYIPISFIKNGIFAGVDIFPPIYASKQLVCKLFLWDSKTYFGFLNPMGPIELVPYYLIFSILDKVFHSPIIVEKAFIFLILFMIGLSAYFLIYTINPQSSSISRLLPSILYIFNPYTLISLWQLRLFGWAISVILLGLIIKGLNEINERQNRYIVIAIISILTISCAVNPPTYLVLWIPIGLYFIFSYFFNDKVHTSKFFLKMIMILIPIHCFWITPFLFIGAQSSPILANTSISWVQWTGVNAILENTFRLLGSWTWDVGPFDSLYYPYSPSYKNAAMIIIGFLIPILSFFCIIVNKSKLILFFSSLGLLGLFLSKGLNPPFGDLFVYIYKNIPLFSFFREPFILFIPIVTLSYMVMLSYTCVFIYNWIKAFNLSKRLQFRLSPKHIFGLITIILILYAWPFFTGDYIPQERGYYPGLMIHIPDYWYDASHYINSEVDGRLLLLPQNPFYQVHYFWWNDGYYGIDPAYNFLLVSLVSQDPGGGYIKPPYSEKIINQLYANYLKNGFNLSNVLAVMNTKYILHRKDLDWTNFGDRNDAEEPSKVKSKLQNDTNIHLVESFGRFDLNKIKSDQWFLNEVLPKHNSLINDSVLDLYKMDDNRTLPIIYWADAFKTFDNFEDLFDYVSSSSFQPGRSILFAKNQLFMNQEKFLNNHLCSTNRSFETYLNNTEYKNTKWVPKTRAYESDRIYSINNIYESTNLTSTFSENRPSITFRQVNPTKYEINIASKKPFFLVFSASFDPKWKIFVEDGLKPINNVEMKYSRLNVNEAKASTNFDPKDILFLFSKPLPEDNHFTVNGYANAWYISNTGNYSISLNYMPQSIFYFCAIISALSIIGCIFYLLYWWICGFL